MIKRKEPEGANGAVVSTTWTYDAATKGTGKPLPMPTVSAGHTAMAT